MKAFVMAGGTGTRLYPYSATMPKPLVPIGDRPVLEILLSRLAGAGVEHAILGVNHLRHLIEAFFGDGSRQGIRISYSIEDKPLGTAGPIGLALEELGDTFVVSNGDLLTTLDIAKMIAEHKRTGADATIGAYRRELKSDFGILEVDEDMRMVGYSEKPVMSHLVSMGIYILQKAAAAPHIVGNTFLNMPDLLAAIAGAGGRVQCFEDKGCFWLDIGRPEDLATAQRLWDENPSFFEKG